MNLYKFAQSTDDPSEIIDAGNLAGALMRFIDSHTEANPHMYGDAIKCEVGLFRQDLESLYTDYEELAREAEQAAKDEEAHIASISSPRLTGRI